MRVVPPAMRRQLGEGANSSILQRLVAFFGYGGAVGIAADSLLRLQSLQQEVDKARCTDPRCELSAALRAEVDAAVNAAGLSLHADNITVFVSSGLHAMSGGSLALGAGAAVGVPRTFLCDSPTHPLLAGLRLHGERVATEEGIDDDALRVRELLVRSPQCRGFALAHELGHVAREDGLVSVALWSGTVIGTTRGIVGAMRASRPLRGIASVAVGGAAIVLGRWGMELRADAFARRCGYRTGGLEFLEQRGELNEILRKKRKEAMTENTVVPRSPSLVARLMRWLEERVEQRLSPGDFVALPELWSHPPISLRVWCMRRQ